MLSLLLIVPIGFYTKFYKGPASDLVNYSLGGLFYEIFWCLVIFLIFPRLQPRYIATGVFLGTCALEFLQLWHPVFLEFLRGYFIGRTILGTTFAWSDFLWYFLGSLLGWLWIKLTAGQIR